MKPAMKLGTYAEAAIFGDIIVHTTSGAGSLEALKLAGEEKMNGKIIIDIAKQLLPVWIRLFGKFQHGMFNFNIVSVHKS